MLMNLYEEITALVDGEISEAEKVIELSYKIKNDMNLAFEEHVQSSIKSLLKIRDLKQKTPSHLGDLIRKRILNS